MKKISVLVKQVLMSTLTAGMFAVSFTACSDDSDLMSENNAADNGFIAGGSQLQKPIGLVYTDFINSNDVQILNADTTIISVNKAYADKMGITNFVNHPMGIWQSYKELAYLRRATTQRLEGDKYILNVVPSDLAEIVQDGEVKISTGLYLNPSKAASTRSANSNGFGAQYVEDNGTIHPMAFYIQPESVTRGADAEYIVFSPEDVLCPSATRSGVGDFFTNLFIGITEGLSKGDTSAGVSFNTGGKCNLVSFSPTIKKNIKIECGKESGDTVTIGINCPTNFTLGCRVNLSVSHNKVSNFETAFTGTFAFTPKVTLGSSKKLEVPEDKSTFHLAPLPKMAFSVPVMGVPVPIVLNNQVDLKFNAGVEGKIYAGIQYQFESTFEAGVRYDGKWHPIADGEVTKSKVNFITPRADIHAEAGVGLFLCTDVLIGGVAGPTASIGPKLGGEIDMSFTPFEEIPFKFDAAIKAGLGGEVGGKLSIYGYDLGKYTCPFSIGPEFTLWEYSSWKNDNNDDSESSFYFNDMTKKAQEEAVALKAEKAAKEAEEKIRKANEPENQQQFSLFKNWIRSHPMVKSVSNELYSTLRNNRTLADKIYMTALDETYEYAVATYTVIQSKHYERMADYLIERIYEGRKAEVR